MTGHIHPCGFCGVIECDADCAEAKKEGYRMTDRSKLLAEASSASERLMDFITDNPDWQMPEPKAVISLETAAAFAMVYAKERADAEAAAMRERAAVVAADTAEGSRELHNAATRGNDRDGCNIHAEGWRTGLTIAAAIRALPATGEVGRG
jgi:predicted transcriptional regulator